MHKLMPVLVLLISGGIVAGCATQPSATDRKLHAVAEADESADTTEDQARGVCTNARTTGRSRSSCQRGVQVMSRDALQDEMRYRSGICMPPAC